MPISKDHPKAKKTIEFINIIKRHPIIYDRNDENYGKLSHRRDAWKSVAEMTGMSG